MKKTGFTLVELLAAIAIIAVLSILIVPNVFDNYNKSLIKKMAIEESSVNDASELYLEDHCRSALPGYTCPNTYNKSSKIGYICLSELRNPNHGDDINDYYIEENDVSFKGNKCNGFAYINGYEIKTYLYCGLEDDGTYEYITDDTFTLTDDIKINCQIE